MPQNPQLPVPEGLPENARVIRLRPHPKQRQLLRILENPANREVWIIGGRRFGKTWTMAVAIMQFCLANPLSPAPMFDGSPKRPPTKVCIVGPDYARASRIWEEILFQFPEAIKHKDKNSMTITVQGGAIIKVYSGENIESMRGEGFDLLVPDEAAFLNEVQFDQVCMPTILDRHGRLWAPSTPKFGKKNWFCRRFAEVRFRDENTGQRDEYGEIIEPVSGAAWFHATSFDNPMIDPKDLQREIERRDPLTVQEEYYGVILDAASRWLDHTKLVPIDRKMIPPNVTRCILIDSAWGKPRAGQVDKQTRRRKDATVIAVVDQDIEGNAYIEDGVWSQQMQPEEAYAIMEGFLKKYPNITRIGKEIVADDPFFTNWLAYCKRTVGVPIVGQVPFNRGQNWKIDGIRYWAGELLNTGKMFIAKDCAIWPHLIDEIDNYSEEDSARDLCQDDCLTIMADILQPGIWLGHRAVARREIKGFDPFYLPEAWKHVDAAMRHNRHPNTRGRRRYTI